MNLFCSLLAIPEQFGIVGGIVDGDGEGVGVGFKVTVGAGDGDAVTVTVGAGEGIGDGFFTTTPLFQANFFPDLVQV